MRFRVCFLLVLVAILAVGPLPLYPLPLLAAEVPNSQPETIPRLSPQQALQSIRAPEGFGVSLFAAEPDVQQPVAMTLDARGRVWVAENYTYADQQTGYDTDLYDRIVILQDTDGDGQSDQRRVFWDRAQRLTGLAIGFGGVWATCPPHLLFIPDRNGDDVPDGEPLVMLDGWEEHEARHNFVNGLRWGPDGWLYGRHGILATSWVGTPDTPPEKRTPLNCAIWRFHPVSKKFEVVCHGTTNPWGMDWDEYGQLFFINTVIGHLWHAIPGAHYQRMYGEDLRPYLFDLIPQTADHVHWDAGAEDWTAQRKGLSQGTDRAGGGHAHSGMMIYLGDNWPGKYRGELFTLNLHGRRINQDHLQRAGATYVGQHRPDLLTVEDPWFRGIELGYGPDGGVYLLDWSDIGECHENDGVHRTSGRIYKIVWNKTHRPCPEIDLTQQTSAELVRLQRHRNEWYVRQARHLLHQRAVRGDNMQAVHQTLRAALTQPTDVRLALRSLWCLYVTGGTGEELLLSLLSHPSEHLRVWAIQLLVDQGTPSPRVVAALQQRAATESEGLVLTYLASAQQRLDLEDRWPIAEAILRHAEWAEDRVLPLMVWYGLEPAVASQPERGVQLLQDSQMPSVNHYLARRVTLTLEKHPQAVQALVMQLGRSETEAQQLAILSGMAEALQGWRQAPAPHGWTDVAHQLAQSPAAEIRELTDELSVVFGDGRAMDRLKELAADSQQPLAARRQALRSLVEARAAGLTPLLNALLADRDLQADAVRGLGALQGTAEVEHLLGQYAQLRGDGQQAVIEVLAQRPQTAQRLLTAVQQGIVQAEEIAPAVLRQMQLLGDNSLAEQIAQLWPGLRLIAEDRLKVIEQYRQQLTPDVLAAADRVHGRQVFQRVCGSCHKLFGQGGEIGPELTGSQRHNLTFWLENIVDPSAAVAQNYRLSIIALNDGRMLNGVIGTQTDRTITVQTPTEKIVLDRQTIDEIEPSALSLMPDGLLNSLSEKERRDLFAYLMSPQPVAP